MRRGVWEVICCRGDFAPDRLRPVRRTRFAPCADRLSSTRSSNPASNHAAGIMPKPNDASIQSRIHLAYSSVPSLSRRSREPPHTSDARGRRWFHRVPAPPFPMCPQALTRSPSHAARSKPTCLYVFTRDIVRGSAVSVARTVRDFRPETGRFLRNLARHVARHVARHAVCDVVCKLARDSRHASRGNCAHASGARSLSARDRRCAACARAPATARGVRDPSRPCAPVAARAAGSSADRAARAGRAPPL